MVIFSKIQFYHKKKIISCLHKCKQILQTFSAKFSWQRYIINDIVSCVVLLLKSWRQRKSVIFSSVEQFKIPPRAKKRFLFQISLGHFFQVSWFAVKKATGFHDQTRCCLILLTGCSIWIRRQKDTEWGFIFGAYDLTLFLN